MASGRWMCAAALALFLATLAAAAAGGERPRKRRRNIRQPKPDAANESYGPHARNVLDVWLAKSEKPAPVLVYFHGGGFYGGDKSRLGRGGMIDAQQFIDAGISVAAANYRLSGTAPYPAQMHDAARAIQFLRVHAKKWNLDPARVAATGGSAGAGISLWLAFHDDLADPESEDPVLREGTRLSCAVALRAQCSYDPREIGKIVPGKAYNAENALVRFFGVAREGDWDAIEIDEKLDALLKDASPITHLTKDDPPVMVYHQARQERDGNIHHPNFGRHLEKAMKALDLECLRRIDADYEKLEASFEAERLAFLKKHFGM